MTNASLFFDDKDVAVRTRYIRKAIIDCGTQILEKYPILKHQDALGFCILMFAFIGMFISTVCYISGYIPWWACLLINAIFASLTQEVEHDAIHNLYFKKNRIMNNIMIALGWFTRPATCNP